MTYFPSSGAAAILALKTKRIIRFFRKAGAVTLLAAIRPEEVNIKKRLLFQRMVKKNVLIDVGDGKYYLHEENYSKYRKNRRRKALYILVLLGLLLYFFFVSSRHF